MLKLIFYVGVLGLLVFSFIVGFDIGRTHCVCNPITKIEYVKENVTIQKDCIQECKKMINDIHSLTEYVKSLEIKR